MPWRRRYFLVPTESAATCSVAERARPHSRSVAVVTFCGARPGIIRTLGATPGRILAIFLAEAAAITLTSALLTVCIALPLSRMVLNVAERTLLQVTVPMQFSMYGLVLLGSGCLIDVLTVWVVTKLSLRKSVRDVIAYE